VPRIKESIEIVLVTRLILVWSLICVGIVGYGVAQAELYRWVDDEGVVHYSDRVPPEVVSKERRVYSEEGEYVDTLEAPKTPKQLEAEHRQREIEAAQEREAEQRRRYDRMLLGTFTDVSDLETVRDERLAIITSGIQILEEKRSELKQRQGALEARVKAIAQRGDTPSPALIEQLRVLEEKIQGIETQMQHKRDEQERTEKRFAADIQRFQELKERWGN
jgi:hypothetical protein